MLNNELRRIHSSTATSSIKEIDAALTSIKRAKRGVHRVENIIPQEQATRILKLSQACPEKLAIVDDRWRPTWVI